MVLGRMHKVSVLSRSCHIQFFCDGGVVAGPLAFKSKQYLLISHSKQILAFWKWSGKGSGIVLLKGQFVSLEQLVLLKNREIFWMLILFDARTIEEHKF